jgi:Transcriptional regulator
MRNDRIKKSIISATIEIIEKSDGDINNITARKIADKSGVALGLINYHFGSKDNLIAECCRQIIYEKLFDLAPDKIDYMADDGLSDCERLISYARQTFDYIYSNPSIVKISIMSDFKDYDSTGNSSLTQKGFQMALRGDISEKRKKLVAFSLASIMQTAFLAGDNSEFIIGYSLKSKKQRDEFISDTVMMLMNDITEKKIK